MTAPARAAATRRGTGRIPSTPARWVRGLCAFLLLLTPTACSSEAIGLSFSTPRVLKVGVTPRPDGEILAHVDKAVAPALGFELDPVRFTDAAAAKEALRDKLIDVAFVRNDPEAAALGQVTPGRGLAFVAPVFVEPLAVYSSTIARVSDLEEGGEVLIPSESAKAGRALRLLAAHGVVRLREGAGTQATVRDVTANPKHVRITEVPAEEMPRGYDDAVAAVVDVSTAQRTGLTAAGGKVLVLEPADGNAYVNGLFVRAGDEDDPQVSKLAELLRSPSVKAFIEDTYDHTIMPAS
ncbi:MetQ/NlpA family ABC transporter substrate-binding protein [Actinopolymorpha sp. B17G11]|uniref:MetQ/NlpA family ABC transporter substrate-binding protein n=1 Tax=unclassified Actinopolymorpha TaxID=2627063 RepID=UPI0032D99EA4